YKYDRLVDLSPQIVRLRPAPHARTPVIDYSLRVDPHEHFINWQQDPYGNCVARLVFPNQARHLSIEVNLIADLTAINPFDFLLEPYAAHYPFCYESGEARQLKAFLEAPDKSSRFETFAASIDLRRRSTIEFLVELNQRLQREIHYAIRMEPGIQS